MSEEQPKKPRLRVYLFAWFSGCAVVMVIAYTQLLEYYLDLGIDLRTETFLEWTARGYAEALELDTQAGSAPVVPLGPNLLGYTELEGMPNQFKPFFAPGKLRHGKVTRFVNIDRDDDDDDIPIDTLTLCPQISCDVIFFYPYQMSDDQWLYLLHGVEGTEKIYDELAFTEQIAVAIGSVFMAFFLLAAFFGVRSIDKPLTQLEKWSAGLNEQNVDAQLPSLRFRELDALALRLQKTFKSMQQSIDKEKLFLRHASHELRTPIAILSSNVELMDRLSDRTDRSDAERASFERQYRALEDIQLLIETLLWINRQSEHLPKTKPVTLASEVENIVEAFRYLVDQRDVVVDIQADTSQFEAPIAAVRIVLSNLIRNALQYTLQGQVLIEIKEDTVTITNHDASLVGATEVEDDGFGFGIELVTLMCDRFGWQFHHQDQTSGKVATLIFK